MPVEAPHPDLVEEVEQAVPSVALPPEDFERSNPLEDELRAFEGVDLLPDVENVATESMDQVEKKAGFFSGLVKGAKERLANIFVRKPSGNGVVSSPESAFGTDAFPSADDADSRFKDSVDWIDERATTGAHIETAFRGQILAAQQEKRATFEASMAALESNIASGKYGTDVASVRRALYQVYESSKQLKLQMQGSVSAYERQGSRVDSVDTKDFYVRQKAALRDEEAMMGYLENLALPGRIQEILDRA